MKRKYIFILIFSVLLCVFISVLSGVIMACGYTASLNWVQYRNTVFITTSLYMGLAFAIPAILFRTLYLKDNNMSLWYGGLISLAWVVLIAALAAVINSSDFAPPAGWLLFDWLILCYPFEEWD